MAGGPNPDARGATGRGHAHGRPPGVVLSARATCCSRRRRPARAGAIRSTVPSTRCRMIWSSAPSPRRPRHHLYGAVLAADGRVDAAATGGGPRRAPRGAASWPARRQPRARPPPNARARRPARRPVGVARDAPGHALDALPLRAGAGPDPRELARVRRLPLAAPAEAGRAVRLNPQMEVRMYACPGCGMRAGRLPQGSRTARTLGWRWRSGPRPTRSGPCGRGPRRRWAALARGALAQGSGVSRRRARATIRGD